MDTTTQENNRAIALFMGAEYKLDDYNDMGYWFKQNPGQEFHLGYHVSGLKYHRSWNWLMEVIEKIESLGYQFTLYNYSSIIRATEPTVPECRANCTATDKLSSAYNTVIGFIKFHNKLVLTEQSISNIPAAELDTIDTFQNKNRGFKEDERERFINY